jgi:hypothetical protein
MKLNILKVLSALLINKSIARLGQNDHLVKGVGPNNPITGVNFNEFTPPPSLDNSVGISVENGDDTKVATTLGKNLDKRELSDHVETANFIQNPVLPPFGFPPIGLQIPEPAPTPIGDFQPTTTIVDPQPPTPIFDPQLPTPIGGLQPSILIGDPQPSTPIGDFPTLTPRPPLTRRPTPAPTKRPTNQPTPGPTALPTGEPTTLPTINPSFSPTDSPSERPTLSPSAPPVATTTNVPTYENSINGLPTINFGVSSTPSVLPSGSPSIIEQPTSLGGSESNAPSSVPSLNPATFVKNPSSDQNSLGSNEPSFAPTSIQELDSSNEKESNQEPFGLSTGLISLVASLGSSCLIFIVCIFVRRKKKREDELTEAQVVELNDPQRDIINEDEERGVPIAAEVVIDTPNSDTQKNSSQTSGEEAFVAKPSSRSSKRDEQDHYAKRRSRRESRAKKPGVQSVSGAPDLIKGGRNSRTLAVRNSEKRTSLSKASINYEKDLNAKGGSSHVSSRRAKKPGVESVPVAPLGKERVSRSSKERNSMSQARSEREKKDRDAKRRSRHISSKSSLESPSRVTKPGAQSSSRAPLSPDVRKARASRTNHTGFEESSILSKRPLTEVLKAPKTKDGEKKRAPKR